MFWFLSSFRDVVSFLRIFQYISFRTALAAVFSLLFSLLIGPAVIRFATNKQLGEKIRTDGPKRHLKKAGTPTMGGLLIITATVFSVGLFGNLENNFVILTILAVIAFGILGFIDDYLKAVSPRNNGLAAGIKLAGQIIISSVIGLYIYLSPDFHEYNTILFVPFFKNLSFDLGFWYIAFAVLLITGFSNAVNLTDGLDGLAIGLSIFAFIAYAGFCYVTGHVKLSDYLLLNHIAQTSELTIVCGAIIGGSIGFLWFNAHPAQIFMGDTGSLTLGGAIGVIALLVKQELILPIVGGVFVIEALSVIIQVGWFKMTGTRVFKMAPLHHHFELMGWHENKIITRFWIVGAIFVLLSLATLKIR